MPRSLFPLSLLLILWVGVPLAFAQQKPILKLNAEMHISSISAISTDKQGAYILTGSNDKTAKLWDAKTGLLIRTIRIPIGQD